MKNKKLTMKNTYNVDGNQEIHEMFIKPSAEAKHSDKHRSNKEIMNRFKRKQIFIPAQNELSLRTPLVMSVFIKREIIFDSEEQLDG